MPIKKAALLAILGIISTACSFWGEAVEISIIIEPAGKGRVEINEAETGDPITLHWWAWPTGEISRYGTSQ